MDIFLRKEDVFVFAHYLRHRGYRVQCKRTEDEIYKILLATEGSPTLDAFRSKKGHKTDILNFIRIDRNNDVEEGRPIQLLAGNVNLIRFILFDFCSSKPPYTTIFPRIDWYQYSNSSSNGFPNSQHGCMHIPSIYIDNKRRYLTRHPPKASYRAIKWMNKHYNRGFTLITGSSDGKHEDLTIGKRSTTDKKSWTLHFTGTLSSVYMFPPLLITK